MQNRTIKSLLIANRGEIACRIMRTAQRMGIRCVAVYSEADAHWPHVQQADAAHCIGPAAAKDSYLNVQRVLDVARAEGVDAIHPGYGFLSENTDFARHCAEADIIFIGPPAKAIEQMGSKSAAKAMMADAGVPLVPGYHGAQQDIETLMGEAKTIGLPLLIKASAGGGGKGMRIVRDFDELQEQLSAAQREAQSAFGDGRVLLEKYLQQPRHVEVQILFDQHGKGVYLFDRDCSLQRRHQKIIEEAPAPNIDPELRRAMGEAALRCGEATAYVGAGTVEFLLDADQSFYFMEMNTRLQVEHPVTEAISGLDLVEWQLRVAAGEALPWSQKDLKLKGHAMEARLYAEDPERDFLPTSGLIRHLRMPSDSETLRVDSGIAEGLDVGSDYDPMLAKIITWGEDRDSARRRLIEALAQTRLGGFNTNLAFLARALKSDAFANAKLSTHFVEDEREWLHQSPFSPAQKAACAWLLWYLEQQADVKQQSADADPWSQLLGWRLLGSDVQQCEVTLDGEALCLYYGAAQGNRAELRIDSESLPLQWRRGSDGRLELQLGNKRITLAGFTEDAKTWTVFAEGESWRASINQPEAGAEAQDEHALTAPMHGRVTAVLCEAGEQVEAGQPLVVMEAMKMEHTIRAPARGKILAVLCSQDEGVAADQPLVEFDAEQAE